MKLETFLEVADELSELYNDEVAVSILDTEKLLAWYPGPNLNAPTGQKSGINP